MDQEFARLKSVVTKQHAKAKHLEERWPEIGRRHEMLKSALKRCKDQNEELRIEIATLQQSLSNMTLQRDLALEQRDASEVIRGQEQQEHQVFEQTLGDHHLQIHHYVHGLRNVLIQGPFGNLMEQVHGNQPGIGIAEEEPEEEEEEEPEEEEEEEPEEEPMEEDEQEEEPEEPAGPESEDEGQVDD